MPIVDRTGLGRNLAGKVTSPAVVEKERRIFLTVPLQNPPLSYQLILAKWAVGPF